MKAKDKAIRRHLLKQPMVSDRKIAALLGCEPKDVNQIRRDMLAAGEIQPSEVDEELVDDI